MITPATPSATPPATPIVFPTEHPPLRFEGAGGDPRARRLVEAAYDLLGEEGLEGLTIRAVLARTGLARRAFYDNFSGKDDLVLAVFARTIQLAADYYREMAAQLDRPMARLGMIVTSIGMTTRSLAVEPDAAEAAAGSRRSAALAREHLRLGDSRPRELKAALAPLLALIAETLREGIRQGQVRAGDPELQAAMIYNLVSTTVHGELLAGDTTGSSPERRGWLAGELWAFCRRAIEV